MTWATDRPNYGFKVLIHQSELDNLAGWVLEYPERETGGDLFGFWTHSGSPTVQLVLGPGTRARHESAAFFQDVDHLQRTGKHVQDHYGLQHIGDWHSHHQMGLAVPSSGDVSTARRVFDYTEFPRFMLFIANIRPGRGDDSGLRRWGRSRSSHWLVEVGAFLFERGETHYRQGQWVVLPDANPVAESVRQASVADRPRQPTTAWSVPRTTLDSPVSESRAPAAGWYTQAWGTDFLRSLDGRCRDTFADCRITLTPETGELVYTLLAGQRGVRVSFPADFPVGAPRFTGDDGLEVMCDEGRTEGAESFFERLLAFVRTELGTRHVAPATADRDDVREEPAHGMERRAADSPGAGADDPTTLLSDSSVAQSDRAVEDVPGRALDN